MYLYTVSSPEGKRTWNGTSDPSNKALWPVWPAEGVGTGGFWTRFRVCIEPLWGIFQVSMSQHYFLRIPSARVCLPRCLLHSAVPWPIAPTSGLCVLSPCCSADPLIRMACPMFLLPRPRPGAPTAQTIGLLTSYFTPLVPCALLVSRLDHVTLISPAVL